MWFVKTVIVVILILLILGFTVQNGNTTTTIDLSYIYGDPFEVPLIYVAYWAFLFGMLISLVLFATIYFKQVSEIRKHKRLAEGLSSEIAALRNRPITDDSDKFLRSGRDDNK